MNNIGVNLAFAYLRVRLLPAQINHCMRFSGAEQVHIVLHEQGTCNSYNDCNV